MATRPFGYPLRSVPFDPYAQLQSRVDMGQAAPVHPAVIAARMAQGVATGMHPAAAQQWAERYGTPESGGVVRPSGDLYGGSVSWGSSAGDDVLKSTAEGYARQFEALFGLANTEIEIVDSTSWGPGTPAELVDRPGPVESMRIARGTELWRLPAIVAHEYGHAMQIASGYDPGAVARELDATRIAGRFLRLAGHGIDGGLADLSGFQGSAVHGSREQQLAALQEGFYDPDGAWFAPYQNAGRAGAPSSGSAPVLELEPPGRAQQQSLSWQLGLQTWDAMVQTEVDFSAALAQGTLGDPAVKAQLAPRLDQVRKGLDALGKSFSDDQMLFWLDGTSGELKLPVTLGRLKADLASLENLIAGKTLDVDVDGFRFTGVEDKERGKVSLKQRNVVFHFERQGAGGEAEHLDVRVHSVRYAPDAPPELQARRTAVPLPSAAVGRDGQQPSGRDERYALTPEQVQALFGRANAALFDDGLTARRADLMLRKFGAEG
ncbi:MAG: hypothetical protein IPJ65_29075 [Archangiaceae bacterium]|nr:hypothetical protein [Archangiaceae bacterium]